MISELEQAARIAQMNLRVTSMKLRTLMDSADQGKKRAVRDILLDVSNAERKLADLVNS